MWMLTIAHRSLPGNAEWQYKTVISKRPPEQWLVERLDGVGLGDVPRLDVVVLYAREISNEDASRLAQVLNGE